VQGHKVPKVEKIEKVKSRKNEMDKTRKKIGVLQFNDSWFDTCLTDGRQASP